MSAATRRFDTDPLVTGQQQERCRNQSARRSEAALAVDDITCREVLELLTEYLEGALAPAVEMAVSTHLDGCEGCRRYLEQFNASIDATSELREDTVPADVRESLLAAFRSWPRPDL
jgi:anti-sigma factor RsiW